MDLAPERAPAMSVVLATRSGRAGIAAALAHLVAQSRSSELELVLVVADAASDDAASGPLLREEEAARFASHRVVRLPEIASKAAANAAGVREASAEIVAFAEDHALVAPGWADALLRRFAESDADAVGPLVRNANPATAPSWSDLLLNYGPWLSPAADAPQEALPGFLTAYRRSALRPYEARLEAWLEVENEMHRDMHRRGGKLALAPDAVVAHVNFSRWAPWLAAALAAGRLYAAERARPWSRARRAFYALAGPAIPLVRLARVLAAWPRDVAGLPARWRLVAPLGVGLAADGAGQMLGYAFGAGRAGARMLRFEFARASHLRPAERGLLEAGP